MEIKKSITSRSIVNTSMSSGLVTKYDCNIGTIVIGSKNVDNGSVDRKNVSKSRL